MSMKSLQGRRTTNAARVKLTVYNRTVLVVRLQKQMNVDNIDTIRMSEGRLLHVAGRVTHNARLPRCRLRRRTRSLQAAERRAARVEIVVTSTQRSCI